MKPYRHHVLLLLTFILTLYKTPAFTQSQEPLPGSGNLQEADADPADRALFYFGFSNVQQFAAKGNKVYTSLVNPNPNIHPAPLKHLVTLPFVVKNPYQLSFLPPDEIVYQISDDSIYEYHIQAQTAEVTSMQALLSKIKPHDITSITFTQGTLGCFHGYESKVSYTLHGDHYQLEARAPHDTVRRYILLPGPPTLDTAAVRAFARRIILHRPKHAAIDDLEISATDLATCKKDILDFKHRQAKHTRRRARYSSGDASHFFLDEKNIDFNRLVTLVDSIPTVDPTIVKEALFEHVFGHRSTTSYWIIINLQDRYGQIVELKHIYYEPSPFCVPWMITVGGATTVSMDLEITRFIQTYCPALLPSNNKAPLLHALVKTMYR